MAELSHYDGTLESIAHPKQAANNGRTPTLVHRMKHDKSILALAVSSHNIFAGTQGGEILVYSLDTYDLRRTVEAHRGSVLSLTLAEDQSLLFSSATDPIVNVSVIYPLSMEADFQGLVHCHPRPPICTVVSLRCGRHLLRCILLLPQHPIPRSPEY